MNFCEIYTTEVMMHEYANLIGVSNNFDIRKVLKQFE